MPGVPKRVCSLAFWNVCCLQQKALDEVKVSAFVYRFSIRCATLDATRALTESTQRREHLAQILQGGRHRCRDGWHVCCVSKVHPLFPLPRRREKGKSFGSAFATTYAATVSEEVIKLSFISKETSLYKEDVERNATPVIVFSLVCCEKAKYLSHGKVSESFSEHIRTGKSASKIFSFKKTFLSGTG